jgi:hypothetical protein
MFDNDKMDAEKIIINKLNENISTEQNRRTVLTTALQPKMVDPLDDFLQECGLIDSTSLTTTNSRRRRTAKEEIAFYVDRVQGQKSFEKFWCRYKNDLPGMTNLVRAYNMRPATSVASERLFSIANYVQRKHRASLAPKTLKYTMVLRDRKILSDLIQSMNQ